MEIKELLEQAVRLGACDKSGEATDWKTAAWLFFSPQGREFCEKNKFPTLEQWQAIKDDARPYNIFVDAGILEKQNVPNLAIIGDTQATVIVDDNTKIHRVIVMHGADVKLIVRGYAVVEVVCVEAKFNVIHRDLTAKIFY